MLCKQPPRDLPLHIFRQAPSPALRSRLYLQATGTCAQQEPELVGLALPVLRPSLQCFQPGLHRAARPPKIQTKLAAHLTSPAQG